MLRSLLQAARPLAHANIGPPILFGQALAYAITGHFSWAACLFAQAFGVAVHLFIVFLNDYADRDADAKNRHATPFSGGSRVIQEGKLSATTIRALAVAMGAVVLALGALGSVFSSALPLLALAAIVLMLAYSVQPVALSYRGGGELLQGLGVGAVLPMAGLAAQGALEADLLFFLAPTLVLGVAGNVLTSLPDEKPDREAEKNTVAVRFGGGPARVISLLLHLFGLLLGTLALPVHFLAAAAIFSIGLLLQLWSWVRSSTDRRSTRTFLLLGGATETLSLLGWALALVLTGTT